MIGWLVGCIVVAGAVMLLMRRHARRDAQSDHVETLKNGLLALALSRTCKNDFDLLPAGNYAAYDGSKLPSMSGYSFSNACLSYIGKMSADDPFYSKPMAHKYQAVDKYLRRRFDTEEDVASFFEDLSEKVRKLIEPSCTTFECV
jgi:hypothetical protein